MSKKKKFQNINLNDKYYIDLEKYNNEKSYPNTLAKIALHGCIKTSMQLYDINADKYFDKCKEEIIKLKHANKEVFPNIYAIETLTDDEFKELIKRFKMFYLG